jgi:probable HAF family extracellular repeat protein
MRHIQYAILVAVLYGCGTETEPTRPTPDAHLAGTPRYTVVKYPASLGGTQSRGMAINRRGVVAGWSDQADGSRHAVIWRNGVITDLGTLGAPGSSSTVPWLGLNDRGTVVGISQTSRIDPLDEDWSCEGGNFIPQLTNLICRGFVWDGGRLHELPTLGGHHGFATGVNSWGQVVGWAETPVDDSTCTGVQQLQFRAVLWEPRWSRKRELRPYPGDSTSGATAINDRGQAVGISGDCDQAVGRFSALHAVLWDRGRVIKLPTLGGRTWNTPMDINEWGDVVGFANPPGPGDPEGEFIAHAFLLTKGSRIAKDIGTLDDDALSEAFAINSWRQVVGVSFGGSAGIARPFLYSRGELHNLNDLADVAPDVILSAQDINDAGQITGRIRDAATGNVVMFIATPK